MFTIACSMHKGGVGKTALTVSLAGAYASAGQRVLVVDFDPQGVASAWLGQQPAELEPPVSLPDSLLTGEVPTTYDHPSGMKVWPAVESMFLIDRKLVGESGRERALARLLEQVSDDYDICLIDCPPAFTPLHDAALYAADSAVLPMWVEAGSLRSLETWIVQHQLLRRATGHAAPPAGIVLTQVDDSALTRELGPQLRQFALPVLAELRTTKRLKAAQHAEQTIQQYAPTSSIAHDIDALAAKILPIVRDNEETQR